jgi:hypothetical protein
VSIKSFQESRALGDNVADRERRRAAQETVLQSLPLGAFVTSVAGDGKPYVKIQFETLDAMQDYYGRLVAALLAFDDGRPADQRATSHSSKGGERG